jgi:hypothetical protein
MDVARMLALRELEGVGDIDLGQWFETGRVAFHLRRRLSLAEAGQHGLHVIDVRKTRAGLVRAKRLARKFPYLRRFVFHELEST